MKQVFLTTLLLALGGGALAGGQPQSTLPPAPGQAAPRTAPGLPQPGQALPGTPGHRQAGPRAPRAPGTCAASPAGPGARGPGRTPMTGTPGPAGTPAPMARPGMAQPGTVQPAAPQGQLAPVAPAAQPSMAAPPAPQGVQVVPGAPLPPAECGPGQRGPGAGAAELARLDQLAAQTRDTRVQGYLRDARAFLQSADPAQREAGRALLRAAEALLGLRPAPPTR